MHETTGQISRTESDQPLSRSSPRLDDQRERVLDAIHQRALLSGGLTTFNDFASGPPGSSIEESRNLAGELVQDGFSGLYNRFRGAVGHTKSKPSQKPQDHESRRQHDINALQDHVPRTDPIGLISVDDPLRDQLRDDGTSHLYDQSPLEPPAAYPRPSVVEQQQAAVQSSRYAELQVMESSKQSSRSAQVVLVETMSAEPTVTSEEGNNRVQGYKAQDSNRTGCASGAALDRGRLSFDREQETAHNSLRGGPNVDIPLLGQVSDDSVARNHGMGTIPLAQEANGGQGVMSKQLVSSDVRRPKVLRHPLRSGYRSTDFRTMSGNEGYRELDLQLSDHPKASLADFTSDYSFGLFDGADSIKKGFGRPEVQPRSVRHDDMATAIHNSEENPNRGFAKLDRMRRQVLSKEFWMADEICKECFLCGGMFTAFRRKHHCRTCGCIFDSKCTSIIPGEKFGVQGTLRVCKTCLDIINRRHDSSDSEDSIQEAGQDGFARSPLRPEVRTLTSGKERLTDVLSDTIKEEHLSSDGRGHVASDALVTPMMAIPATRRIDETTNRRSAVLEIEGPQLSRPSSSRSLRSLVSARPVSSNHRRHQSKHSSIGRYRSMAEQTAPFHRDSGRDERSRSLLPAFHDDNIIDPDLAAYMSEEGSSGDEQMSIFSVINKTEGSNFRGEGEKASHNALTHIGRRNRTRTGEKSLASVTFLPRTPEELSNVETSPSSNRPIRRRNLSASSSSVYYDRALPRQIRRRTSISNNDSGRDGSGAGLSHVPQTWSFPAGSPVLSRNASIRAAPPAAAELNYASLLHVKNLLRQLLQDANIPCIAAWEQALVPILLRSTNEVDPDVRRGDDIDIRHYVKLKKIPGGKPSDTSCVSGMVFTKNIALKSMPRHIRQPRIVLVSFPIEYQRHQQHFMSLAPVIAQEKDFLRNLVNRIASLQPQVLLVQKHVSGLALQYLAESNIAVIYNVKQSVLEAVSRFAQTEIISSIDMVSLRPVHVGISTSFDVKSYVHKDIPNQKKTYVCISGCPKELGCTIILRGASLPVLRSIKRIAEFMVYVVYNLKLETCLMRDEFVSIPSTLSVGKDDASSARQAQHKPSLETSNTVAQSLTLDVPQADREVSDTDSTGTFSARMTTPRKSNHVATTGIEHIEMSTTESSVDDSSTNRASTGTLDDLKKNPAGNPHLHSKHDESVPEDVPMPTFYSNMVAKHQTKILSASPFVKFMQPYLLMRAREQERRLVYLKRLRDQDNFEDKSENEKNRPQKFQLIQPEMVHSVVHGASKSITEVLHAVHDAEYDKALHNYQTQKRQWENYIQGNLNLFDPYAHQNIVVLYTVVCTITTVPCTGPELLALEFYNEHEISPDFDPDCTLGQYVEDLCLSATAICTSNGCERRMSEHHRTYVHGEGRVTVFVEETPCKIKGLQDSILMWSYCKTCKKESQVMPMSESTWKYSFGKYLELSFWSTGLCLRADFCPHDLHREHIRYFGFRNMALRVHYDPTDLLEIVVPRTRITWKVDNDLRLKNELFTKSEERWTRFMTSVKSRIKMIRVESVVNEKLEACKLEVDSMTKRAVDEHTALLRKLQSQYMESKYYEIIPLNRAIRAMQEKVAEWDAAFADFDANYFPSERDIRRLAALQLRKMFIDNDVSQTSLASVQKAEHGSDQIEKKDSASIPPRRSNTIDTSATPELTLERAEADSAIVMDSSSQCRMSGPVEITLPIVQHLDLAASYRSDSIRGVQEESPPDVVTDVSRSKADVLTDYESGDSSSQHLAMPANDNTLMPTFTALLSTTAPPAMAISPTSLTSPTPTAQLEDAVQPVEKAISRRRLEALPSTRTQSQPASILRRIPTLSNRSGLIADGAHPKFPQDSLTDPVTNSDLESCTDEKLSDRLGMSASRGSRRATHSLIPRSIQGKRRESRVSTLAKHFEQLSREFEKERLRDRKQRAAKVTQSRAFPKTSSKPIVEVYRNVDEAVQERAADELNNVEATYSITRRNDAEQGLVELDSKAPQETGGTANPDHKIPSENADTDVDDGPDSVCQPDSDDDDSGSDAEMSLLDGLPDITDIANALEIEAPVADVDIPKHEKSSLLKVLTHFWAERSASGWNQLEYPLSATDHVFVDSDIIVREDEPSSLIAFALGSEDYITKLNAVRQRAPTVSESRNASPQGDETEVETSLLRATGTHLKYQFVEGTAKMLCKIFYAEQFDAVRRKCGVAERVVESLSRCLKWDSKGGKTKSVFLKTLDDRLVLKSLSPVETQAFLRFAPAYFNIMAEALFHDLPTVIAKMLGFYQIVIKNPATGTEIKWDVLVMENLFYDRSPTRIFDLKGSMRNRKIQSTGEQNEVLLDENMVEFIYESPLFAREHSKKLLRASVWNDTLFLARQNVMDYSLMVAVDETRRELVVGIIDCIRTYTWDKKLESWIKDRGFAGGGRNRPTVTSPKEYKTRFREAMARYVLQAPDCWHQFATQHVELYTGSTEDSHQ